MHRSRALVFRGSQLGVQRAGGSGPAVVGTRRPLNLLTDEQFYLAVTSPLSSSPKADGSVWNPEWTHDPRKCHSLFCPPCSCFPLSLWMNFFCYVGIVSHCLHPAHLGCHWRPTCLLLCSGVWGCDNHVAPIATATPCFPPPLDSSSQRATSFSISFV